HDKKYRNFLLSVSRKSQIPEMDRKMEREHYRTILDDSLKHLPDQQRLIFNLSKREGLSHEKIAEMLEISPNTVRNHLYQAVKNLRATVPDIEMIALLIFLLTGI